MSSELGTGAVADEFPIERLIAMADTAIARGRRIRRRHTSMLRASQALSLAVAAVLVASLSQSTNSSEVRVDPAERNRASSTTSPRVTVEGGTGPQATTEADARVPQRDVTVAGPVLPLEGPEAPTTVPGDEQRATASTTRLVHWTSDNLEARQLHRLDLGGTSRQITETAHGAFAAAWSPDGEHIAFVQASADRGTEGAIVVANADGTGARLVTDPDVLEATTPSWSPDGRRLSFSGKRPGGSGSGVYVVAAHGGPLRKLTPDDTSYDEFPTWSPDGRRIAFTRSSDVRMPVLVVDVEQPPHDPVVVTPSTLYGGVPSWSPDGTRIAFSGREPTEIDASIWTVSPDGADARSHVGSSGIQGRFVHWSPNGAAILAAHSDGLVVARADGSGSRRVQLPSALSSEATRWASNGSSILFSAFNGENGERGLYVVDDDGGAVTTVIVQPGGVEFDVAPD